MEGRVHRIHSPIFSLVVLVLRGIKEDFHLFFFVFVPALWILKSKRNTSQPFHRKVPAPFLISCPASYYKQRSLQVAPCSSSLFFPIRLGHNCHSFPLITPPWLKVQRMAFVWQIKGRQGFEGTHCCYGDSPNIMWLALLVSVKAKASVISSRDVRREVLSYGQNIWPSTV